MAEKKKMLFMKLLGIVFLVLLVIGLISSLFLNDTKSTKQVALEKSAPQPSPPITPPPPPPKPYAFKEFRLGMTINEFNKLKPNVTYKNKREYQTSCFVDTTIGGANGKAYFIFDEYGKEPQLSFISVTIKKSDFDNVKDALLTKYGKPTSVSEEIKSNAMGAKFSSIKMVWQNDVSQLYIESVGEKINESQMILFHRKLGKSKQEKKDAAKAEKDI